MLLLFAMIESRSRDLDPGGIGGSDAKGIDPDLGKCINGGSIQKGFVALLQDWTALLSKSLAQAPFIDCSSGLGAARTPPDGVVGLFLCKPGAQIDTIGLEGLPIDIFTTFASLGEVKRVLISLIVGFDMRNAEGTLLLILGNLAMLSGICYRVIRLWRRDSG